MILSRVIRPSRWVAVIASAAAASLLLGLTWPAPAAAQLSHPDVVGERPVDWTPHVKDGIVNAITRVGDLIVVGGTFTEVTDASGQVRLARPHLLAFRLGDGTISGFSAHLDGPVYALAPGPDGTVYVGGSFRTVNGAAQRGVTQLRVPSGERVASFDASINWGQVRSMASHDDQLYLAGSFTAVNGTSRVGLARVDAATGAVDPDFDAGLTNRAGPRVNVQAVTLSPSGDRLVAVGGFSHAHHLLRPQMLMMDTSGRQAELANWYTDAYEPRCAPQFFTYLRGVDFSPDGSYVVAVTTGGLADPDRLCNTAARFEATGTGMHRPTWTNHTGGNSLYSVEITGPAVYVGGHQQWMDNPYGNKHPGPGAVEREGIAALDPDTGRALPWNPGRARGVGVQAFLTTPDGLLVGSDTTRLGGVTRERVGMFPLTEQESTPPTPEPTTPGPQPTSPAPEPPGSSPDPDPDPTAAPGPPERGYWASLLRLIGLLLG